jgi:putative ABC transport system substrate-binding protein
MLGTLAHVCAAVLTATAQADEPTIPRIGVVAAQSAYEQGLREGLLKLGYVEGKNIGIDWRRSGGSIEEERSLAIDLLHSKPDLIVVFSTPTARAALGLTTAPIVFMSSDPVGSGLVTNLARPGGNATGVSSTGPELIAKRLQLLRQFVPRARRIGCLVNTSNPVGALQLAQAKKAARALGVELVKFDAHDDAEVDAALHAIARSALDELLVLGDNLFVANGGKIARAVRKAKLPTMSPSGSSWARASWCLMAQA